MTAGVHDHSADEPCAAGLELYARALRQGSVPEAEAAPVACAVRAGLLEPDLEDFRRLRPVAPVLALPRLLRNSAQRIADERRREERLAEMFEQLMRIDGRCKATADPTVIRILNGFEQIDLVIGQVMAGACEELLAIQPYNRRPKATLGAALERDQALLDRGGRIRTLYQHTYRHSPVIHSRYELLSGDVEARTLDEVTERLLVIDRTVAFIPASKDRSLAVEVRHPPLVAFFVTTFDRLWRLATPMYPEAAPQPSLNGITPRQRAIAALLVEGHTDAVIADRLGMNVRTARVHIAKLAATLGSESRAQLGYLIAQSGILDQEG
ncbi:LuxR C-terminal-related transcriptional regulator [Streptomyces sp. KR55]|uniref:LuxR C-terminal-related transcriptional regulator n=1 Tax=Streptomyces sp. KR55 TaxID=3457425 RepID=UPI003FD5212E